MNALCLVKKPVIVDLYIDTIEASMDRESISRIEEIIPLLKIFFLLGQRKRNWEYYKELFLDKYGMYNEIPLLTLLNPDTGLGPPPGYTNPGGYHRETEVDSNEVRYNKYMTDLIIKALLERKDEIELNRDTIFEIRNLMGIEESILHSHTIGFDIKCNIYKKSGDGEYQILLSTNGISTSPGMFWGRFSALLERLNLQNKLEFRREMNGISCAEINYRSEHYADLSLNNIQSKYEIAIGTQPMKEEDWVIQADDLYVGMDAEGFYMRSKKFNKKIKPTASHLLYYSNFHPPNIVRFIYEFSRYNDVNLAPFYLGVNQSLPFIPRFSYKNIILSTAKWNIREGELVTHSFREWCSHFSEFKEKYKIPQYVELIDMDMNLLLNLNKEYCLLILYDAFKKLKKDETLLLSEAPYMYGDLVVTDEHNYPYNSDFVITFEGNDIYLNRKKTYRDDIRIFDHQKYDSSKWIYAKLYGYPYKHKKLLILLQDWVDRNEIERFFFVNYIDQRPHLRFRIKHSLADRGIRSKFTALLENLKSENWITDYIYDTYEPEILRYGGPKLYPIVEELFDADSRWIIKLIQHEKKYEANKLQFLLALATVIDLYPNYNEQMAFLHQLSPGKKHLREFKKNRETYLKMGKEIFLFTKLHKSEYALLEQPYQSRKKIIETINQALDRLDFPEERKFYIKRSILHMSMNRLLGTDRFLEQKIYEIIKNMNHNLYYQNKFLQKEESHIVWEHTLN
jgi:thiopeptide-type bacteriocin biosynthesis protein